VIGRSSGLEEMGGVQLHLVISLFFAWFFTVAAILNGPKTLGKVSITQNTPHNEYTSVINNQRHTYSDAYKVNYVP